MKVSVVICTLNRADSLRQTLRCLTYQRYEAFEVVVVNGPSTDHTMSVLDEFQDWIRTADCPAPNLSMSRNIGIRAAAGDVVAFIDDDALPEFDWLQQALPSFDDPGVAGVGGIVFDHTGVTLQYAFSAANRFAETTYRDTAPYDEFCVPGGFTFPYLQGTNALFRRSALLAIGGFDETFDYYLDETDVCCRLVDAGFTIRQLRDAPVHHKFLPSSIRDHQRVVTNWFPIVKNNTYFSYRHALGAFSEAEVLRRSQAFVEARLVDAWFHENAGRLPPGATERATTLCGEAFGTGVELGRHASEHQLRPLQVLDEKFLRYPVVDSSRRRRILILSGDYAPRITGGIARIMSELAPALVRLGHEVRVITRGSSQSTVDLEDGVWVHRLVCPSPGDGGLTPHTLDHINAFVTAAAAEIDRIGVWAPIDVVYGPAWDVETIAALSGSALPVVVMLATPVAVAATQHDGAETELPVTVSELLRLEREVYVTADLVHALSTAIVDTVTARYGQVFVAERTAVIPLGLSDRRPSDLSLAAPHDGLTVFFVGRLEPRKGITDLLTAIEQLAPTRPDLRFVIAGADTPTSEGDGMIGQTWLNAHQGAAWLSRVDLIGPISDDELHEQYEAADIVVLPSRYESFGLVVVEAMMHGKAIISCNAGGVPEVAQHGIDAMLVPPSDPSALAATIAELAGDPDRRSQLGRSARASYLERLTIERCAHEIVRLLDRLVVIEIGADAFIVDGPTIEAQRSGGRRTVELGRGASAVVRPPTESSLTVTALVDQPTHVLIEREGGVDLIALERKGWTRLRFTSVQGALRLTVISGSVRLGPAVALR